MTGLLLALLAVAPAAEGPCAAVAPLEPKDPEAAAAYLAVAESERAAGARDTAVRAYRQALERDPGNAPARAALEALCREEQGRAALESGLEAMRTRRYRDAEAALAQAYGAEPTPSTALLLAICRYELGRYAEARPLLEEARKDPALEKDAAFYQGLLAFRAGRPNEAASLFESATADPRLKSAASQLMTLARQDGPVQVSLLAQGLYDTNPTLAPDGTPVSTTADGAADATAVVRASIPGLPGPFLRASGEYREQFQAHDYDFAALGGAAGLELGGERYSLLAEYDYDFLMLGGAPYLSAHRLLGSARVYAGMLFMGAGYSARLEQFLPDYAVPYSGLRHWGRAELGLGSGRSGLTLAYQASHHSAQVTELSYLEHGPVAEGRLTLGRVRLFAAAGVLFRDYDAVDPDLGLRRSDLYVDGEAVLEIGLTDRWSAQLAATGRQALSNVAELQYTKVTCALRLGYAIGLP